MLIGPDKEDLPVVMDVEGETSRQLIRYTTGHLCTYIVEQNIFWFLRNWFWSKYNCFVFSSFYFDQINCIPFFAQVPLKWITLGIWNALCRLLQIIKSQVSANQTGLQQTAVDNTTNIHRMIVWEFKKLSPTSRLISPLSGIHLR